MLKMLQRGWQSVKNASVAAYEKGKTLAVTAGAGVASYLGLGGTESAHAALPAEATAAFSTLSTSVTDILSAVWPIVAAVVGGFALIKLFKKGANKAV